MKRTWYALFLSLAMMSGATPPLAAQAECPLTGYEPYDQHVSRGISLPCGHALLNPYRSMHDPQYDDVVYGQPPQNSGANFWDGYHDYLMGFYPFDYYDDTAELLRVDDVGESHLMVNETCPAGQDQCADNEAYELHVGSDPSQYHYDGYGDDEAYQVYDEGAYGDRGREAADVEPYQYPYDESGYDYDAQYADDGYDGYAYESEYGEYGYWQDHASHGYDRDVNRGADDQADDADLADESYADRDYSEQYGYASEYERDYEYEYGEDYRFDHEPEGWNSGIDDLYARRSDVAGNTQSDSWFDDDAWNSFDRSYDEAYDVDGYDGIDDVQQSDAWGEGDFYSANDLEPNATDLASDGLEPDYESQWDGTADWDPMDEETYWSEYEESWFEQDAGEHELDYQGPTQPAQVADQPARDYWEEYSDYVEPRDMDASEEYWSRQGNEWGAAGWESGEDWQSGEDEGVSQFLPADSPLPESHWDEEYEPYDAGPITERSAPYHLPYASLAMRAPLVWASKLRMPGERMTRHLRIAGDLWRDSLGWISHQLESRQEPEMLPPLEEWNCHEGWDVSGDEECWDD